MCAFLRHRILDLIENKLIQFDNMIGLNNITNPLPPNLEGNMNPISIEEERIPDFSSPSFPWESMLQAIA